MSTPVIRVPRRQLTRAVGAKVFLTRGRVFDIPRPISAQSESCGLEGARLHDDAAACAGRITVWIRRPAIGAAWLAIAEHVLDHGSPGSWDGEPLREVLRAALEVDTPEVSNSIIDRYADPERLAWMHANFSDPGRVAELDHTDSYATWLYEYARSGRNQID